MTIAALVITYNEEANLENCLKSIAWVDQIVIVDSGSIDQTIKIGKKYTKRIYYYKFSGNYSEIRNYGLSKIHSDWVLVIDGDESLSYNAEQVIKKGLDSKKNLGYWIPRRNYISFKKYLKHGIFYPDYQLRLIRVKPGILYKNYIHEIPNIPEEDTNKLDNIYLNHSHFRTKYDSFLSFRRFFPYIVIESNEILKKDISFTHLTVTALYLSLREFYKSFIRGKGFLDGYLGFRAALIFSVYRSSVYYYAAYRKLWIK